MGFFYVVSAVRPSKIACFCRLGRVVLQKLCCAVLCCAVLLELLGLCLGVQTRVMTPESA